MFERLLSLFLHAKSGVFAGVFLVGTTGALVTATVQNGVTTITITEASPSPSGSASPRASASASASPSATGSATASPTASPTASLSSSTSSAPSDCKSTFQAGVDATKRVDTAFVGFHTDLMHLRQPNSTDAAKKTIENADKLLKQIRESAVKAIHASTSCFKRDDDDKMDNHQDENDNEDGDKNDEHEDQPKGTPRPTPTATRPAGTDTFTPVLTVTPTPTPTPVIGTSTDPKTIADNAVAAMKLVFDTAKAGLPTPAATPSRSPKPSRSPEARATNGHNGSNNKDGHGKGD
jgi:hypothetical protein